MHSSMFNFTSIHLSIGSEDFNMLADDEATAAEVLQLLQEQHTQGVNMEKQQHDASRNAVTCQNNDTENRCASARKRVPPIKFT